MGGPYVNEDGDIWIEKGSRPWPRVLYEARGIVDEQLGPYPQGILRYEGIDDGVRVSDERESPHWDDEDCGEDRCCRTVVAYHFRAVEP